MTKISLTRKEAKILHKIVSDRIGGWMLKGWSVGPKLNKRQRIAFVEFLRIYTRSKVTEYAAAHIWGGIVDTLEDLIDNTDLKADTDLDRDLG